MKFNFTSGVLGSCLLCRLIISEKIILILSLSLSGESSNGAFLYCNGNQSIVFTKGDNVQKTRELSADVFH